MADLDLNTLIRRLLALVAPASAQLGVAELGQMELKDGFLQPVVLIRASVALVSAIVASTLPLSKPRARTLSITFISSS